MKLLFPLGLEPEHLLNEVDTGQLEIQVHTKSGFFSSLFDGFYLVSPIFY